MSKNITIIPPSEGRPDVLRVAAYCRVSTALEEQESSYASQIRSYTELISQHEGWELVDIYADEAASGTKTDKREDFNRLLADCRKGKIDRVLVKSISRFSRNTKDCLAALRELMRLGVTVQFEKENMRKVPSGRKRLCRPLKSTTTILAALEGTSNRTRKAPGRKSQRDSCRGYSPDRRYSLCAGPRLSPVFYTAEGEGPSVCRLNTIVWSSTMITRQAMPITSVIG